MYDISHHHTYSVHTLCSTKFLRIPHAPGLTSLARWQGYGRHDAALITAMHWLLDDSRNFLLT